MSDSFFKAVSNLEPIKLFKDIIIIVRDVLEVSNNFMHLQMISQLINFINLALDKFQENPKPNII